MESKQNQLSQSEHCIPVLSTTVH